MTAGDILALAAGLTYALGGPIAGIVGDKYFVRRLKRLLMLSLIALSANFALVVLSMPPPPFLVANSNSGVHFGLGASHRYIVCRYTRPLHASTLALVRTLPPCMSLPTLPTPAVSLPHLLPPLQHPLQAAVPSAR